MKRLKFIAIAATLSTSISLSPLSALAAELQGTSSGSTGSDPSGLGSAYNYQIPGGAPTTCCTTTYDHGNANGNAVNIMKNFNQKLAAMQLAIIESLRLLTGQLSGNMREQTGAEHTLADQQDDRATVKAVEEARLKALVDATSGTSSCYVITGAGGGGGLQGTAGTSSVAYGNEIDKYVRGESTYSKEGPEKADLFRLEAYCSNYATQADVDANLCNSVGKLPAASVNAAESIFNTGATGNSETYSEDRAAATNAFILNAMSPTPYPLMSPTESQTSQGRLQATRYKTQMARESIGRQIAIEYAKNRDPQNGANNLAAWAKARVSKMKGMEGVDVNKLSYQQWMKIYAQGFLLDPDGLASSDQNPVTAIKDIKNMMAVLNYILYEQLEQTQKINVQLATQTAILNEQTRNDGVFKLSANQ